MSNEAIQWFDTHVHLNSDTLGNDLDGVLARAREHGVARMVVIGYSIESSQRAVELAEQYEHLHAAVAVSPHFAHEATDDDLAELARLARHPRVVAIGETGFEGHYHPDKLDEQRVVLDAHAALAREHGLPLVIHLREADDAWLSWMEQNNDVRLVMHCFSAGAHVAQACLEAGHYLSFAGPVTFRNAGDLRDIAATVPIDRLLIETDCPYLSPGRYRGKKPCEPYMLPETGGVLAQAHGLSIETMAAITWDNAVSLFQRPAGAP